MQRPLSDFLAALHKNGLDDRRLTRHVQHMVQGDLVSIHIVFPEDGQYGLDLYTRDSAQQTNGTVLSTTVNGVSGHDKQQLLTHCCKYLINVTRRPWCVRQWSEVVYDRELDRDVWRYETREILLDELVFVQCLCFERLRDPCCFFMSVFWIFAVRPLIRRYLRNIVCLISGVFVWIQEKNMLLQSSKPRIRFVTWF